ncbi:noncanonical pyrimidine nucleotidase, YjjG family [Zunongwangia sp. SCSIO 43204]|uniref:YjjG family noncanonical pyrimidine nucleotidase n=1 Tax=Zunongwangia sp. SCSIO 43204 TaxID=2779359 RepID=UPI001CA855EE|nr:YjjG family noncanonical pyrimidine nucleotidase [Zunongwangia sp. SCSIO 43204]UAB84661.1 noncanonical pyrimidine nucleotidase, YjjG family [Zunongwangia sp. SCSIO 43204]
MKLNNIEHVFFDLDHTLWDFDKNSALTFEYIFKLNKIDLELSRFLEVYIPINFDYWENYRKNLVSKEKLRYGRLKDSFLAVSYPVDDTIIDKLSNDYILYLSEYNHLLDGGVEALDYLSEKYTLHIITNGFEEVQHKKLKNSNILNYFNTITTSEEAGVKKPHPTIFEMSLKKANALPEKSVMIGDNYEADIIGAADFGLQTIYFDYYNKSAYNNVIGIKNLKNLNLYL